jgi:hypothetical protein
MAERKYAKYVHSPRQAPKYVVPQNFGKVVRQFVYGDAVFPESEIWVECELIVAPGGHFGFGDDISDAVSPDTTPQHWERGVHRHPHPEIFFYIGLNPDDPDDLGGEYEFWIGEGEEAEQYIFDKTTCIYIPRNTYHNPNTARRVDRPFMMLVIMPAPHWVQEGDHSMKLPPGFPSHTHRPGMKYGWND